VDFVGCFKAFAWNLDGANIEIAGDIEGPDFSNNSEKSDYSAGTLCFGLFCGLRLTIFLEKGDGNGKNVVFLYVL
jgi:hypothetical protein